MAYTVFRFIVHILYTAEHFKLLIDKNFTVKFKKNHNLYVLISPTFCAKVFVITKILLLDKR